MKLKKLNDNKKIFIIILVISFFIRLLFINTAHHGDLNNNISWGEIAVSEGLNGFYGSSDANDWPFSAPNQPPLSILMFMSTVKVYTFINSSLNYLNTNLKIFPSKTIWYWEESGMDIIVKLPSIFADLGIAWIIFDYFFKKKERKKALVFSSIWLFNPIVFYNSSIWGQTDSVVNLLGMLAVAFLLNKKLIYFAAVITASFLFKGSLLIFLPIFLFIAYKQNYELKEWVKAIGACIVVVFLITYWFHRQIDLPIWLFNLYTERILPGEIGYLTANSFNFWWLVDSGKTLDSNIYFGIPARVWGFVILVFSLGGSIWFFLRKKINDKKVFLTIAIVALTSFLFMTRIHERYMYPFFPYATIALAYLPGFWVAYALLSFTHLVNLYYLFWVPSLPGFKNFLLTSNFENVLAVVNLVTFLYILKISTKAKV